MTTTAPTATPEATREVIEAGILAALPATRALVPWRTIRPSVPGQWWQQTQALTRLHEIRAVYVVKIGGKNYVSLEHGPNAPGGVLGQPREFRAL
jgi:hypothetical protein